MFHLFTATAFAQTTAIVESLETGEASGAKNSGMRENESFILVSFETEQTTGAIDSLYTREIEKNVSNSLEKEQAIIEIDSLHPRENEHIVPYLLEAEQATEAFGQTRILPHGEFGKPSNTLGKRQIHLVT